MDNLQEDGLKQQTKFHYHQSESEILATFGTGSLKLSNWKNTKWDHATDKVTEITFIHNSAT